MTLRIEGQTVWLEGACGIGDAEPLYAALSAGLATTADLSLCLDIHAALTQTLMKFPVKVAGEAPDAFVRDFVTPALERARTRSS